MGLEKVVNDTNCTNRNENVCFSTCVFLCAFVSVCLAGCMCDGKQVNKMGEERVIGGQMSRRLRCRGKLGWQNGRCRCPSCHLRSSRRLPLVSFEADVKGGKTRNIQLRRHRCTQDWWLRDPAGRRNVERCEKWAKRWETAKGDMVGREVRWGLPPMTVISGKREGRHAIEQQTARE